MDREELSEVLADVDASLWAGVILPGVLPEVATQLVADGADTPALRSLAGLDLGPFDPRDARDVFIEACEQIGVEVEPISDRVGRAACVLASALLDDQITEREGTRGFYRLAVAAEYPDDPLVMSLYGMDDEWDGGWGRTAAELAQNVRAMAAQILERRPRPSKHVVVVVSVKPYLPE